MTDDESDFELSDMSEDDYEDEGITNTMLLTGPHGIGKTATVYALAHELGYKVGIYNFHG
jgi:DNA polymerase III delta prime subunit